MKHHHPTRPGHLDVPGLRALLAAGRPPRLIDVRSPAEFETVHIPGAYNVPLETLREHRAELAALLDQDVVLVCRSGTRAGPAVAALTDSCAMGALLARLPYNRTATCDPDAVLARLLAETAPG